MKITEELWNEYGYDVERVKSGDFNFNLNGYYFTIMKKITKKEVLMASIQGKITTNEGHKKYLEIILGEEFLNKHNLTPAFNFVSSKVSGEKYISPSYYDLSGFRNFDHQLGSEKLEDLRSLPLMLFGDNIVVALVVYNSCDNDDNIYESSIFIDSIYYTSDKADEVKELIKSLHEINQSLPTPPDKREGMIKLGFAYRTPDGRIETYNKFVKVKDIQLDQFNESLPHEKIVNILNKDEAGLILLHGEPGCGKSSYIRLLIRECREKYFIILSQDLLQNMDSFREFLLRVGDNSVVVIEDCENLVKSRERSGSSIMISDFLNMTDGIYGDLYRSKFILTFNTDVQTIDPALLRKGRLKCKYKFNKLKGERLKKIAERLGLKLNDTQIESGLSLADLFNYDDDNGGKQKEVVKIGFK